MYHPTLTKMILSRFHSPDAVSSHFFPNPRKRHACDLARSPITSHHFSCLLKVGFDHIPLNSSIIKVLVVFGVSAAIGQLSKLFTSVLHGKDFDFKDCSAGWLFPFNSFICLIHSGFTL